ncbi:MAG: hypothetical protein L0228_01320 [Planctomycetes bacterium]|nr:hypothetical protein [Planctomycetota bacterium]
MRRWQFSLTSMLLIVTACPIWVLLIIFLPENPNIHFLLPPFVLCGVTVAVQRLVRRHRDAWAISVLFAGLIVTAFLIAVALLDFWLDRMRL